MVEKVTCLSLTCFPHSSDLYGVTSYVVLHTQPASGFSERLKSVNMRLYPHGEVLDIISSNVSVPFSLQTPLGPFDFVPQFPEALYILPAFSSVFYTLDNFYSIVFEFTYFFFCRFTLLLSPANQFLPQMYFSVVKFPFFSNFYFSAEFSCLFMISMSFYIIEHSHDHCFEVLNLLA